MSSNNSGEKFWGFIFIGAIILGAMWLFDAGPFEKSYTPAPTYYNGYGGGGQPSFTGGKYKCRSHGCDCSIKRSELEAAGLIRCGCGHLTTYHYD